MKISFSDNNKNVSLAQYAFLVFNAVANDLVPIAYQFSAIPTKVLIFSIICPSHLSHESCLLDQLRLLFVYRLITPMDFNTL